MYTYIRVCMYNQYLPLVICLAAGKIFHLAKLLFLFLDRDNNGIHITELLGDPLNTV